MANAYRNDVDARIRARAEDLFTFTCTESYDLVVASLYQMPVDPHAQRSGHRPQDYWGRNLVDHLIRLLPDILTADGRALVMQLSILGRLRTAELLDEAGLTAQIVDFDTFGFGPVFQENLEQIRRVEQLSPQAGGVRRRHGGVSAGDHALAGATGQGNHRCRRR